MNKGIACFFWVTSLALLGALPGCSSDASPGGAGAGECSSFTACGGDLVGTWHVSAACLSDSANAQIEDAFKVCAAASVSLGSVDYTGTVSYTADTVTSDLSVAVKLSETIPTSCLNGQSCAALQSSFAGQASNGVSNATCTAAADGCACAFELKVPSKSSGPYTASGTTFTETDPSDGSTDTSQYCVAGNQLKVKTEDGVIALTR